MRATSRRLQRSAWRRALSWCKCRAPVSKLLPDASEQFLQGPGEDHDLAKD